jgi:hypothetical protein
MRTMTSDEIAAAEPAFKTRLAGAVHWTSSWSCADPGGLTEAYAKLFTARGGTIVTADATTLERRGGAYSLLSLSPINKQNNARTDVEREGLKAVADNKDQNFYKEEQLGKKRYLTAIYPDVAIADACVKCHNDHKDSPRRDFRLNDVMGAIAIRIPINN